MKDALANSEKIGGASSKLLPTLSLIVPPGIATAIGINADFTLPEWLWYPAGAFLGWLSFLMLLAAFNKHQEQQARIKNLEEAGAIKMTIDAISYQHDISKGRSCRVTVRNISTTTVAENVHVRISGEVVPGVFFEGYSPFNEPDLLPASGSRSINPGSASDWLFPDSFNQLADCLTDRIQVAHTLYNTPELLQTFSIQASGASSPPVVVRFDVGRDGAGKLLFNRLSSDFDKTDPATIR